MKTKISQSKTYQFSSVAQSCLTLCDPMDCSTPGFSVHHQHRSLCKLMTIKSVMPSKHLIFCHPLFLLPSVFFSIRVISKESVLCIRWPKYWSFSFSISPSNEYSELIPLWLTGLISLQSKDSQESSPTSQFKSINSSLLSFLHGPTLTSRHDCDFTSLYSALLENHGFD